MSLRNNIIANYASQAYITVISLLMVPLYIRYMGVEAYGLVGFYWMLESWFVLLDMGLTTTMQRETARYCAGVADGDAYRRLLRVLERLFLAAALAGGSAIYLLSHPISIHWLHNSHLPHAEVERAVRLIACILAFRWMGSLYRGTISGSERQVWLGGFNSAVATFRAGGLMLALIHIGATPTVFFAFQCVIAAAELIGMLLYAYRFLPAMTGNRSIPKDGALLKPLIGFSLAVGLSSMATTVVSELDKLMLSNILSLKGYGYFSIAILVADGVNRLSLPVMSAMLPRMSRLEAAHDHAGLIRIYRQSTQLVTVFAGSAAITIAFCAEPLLFAWTGDRALAVQTAPILQLYALGNGIMVLGIFQYYLQYAKGELRLHLIWTAFSVVVLIPSIIWAATRYGAVGSGFVWLGINLVAFMFWQPFVHARYAPSLNLKWYAQDVLVIASAACAAGYAGSALLLQGVGRWSVLAGVAACGLLVLLAGSASSSAVKTKLGWSSAFIEE